MDNLKRKNQISDSDLQLFREQEINKILIKAEESKPTKFKLNLKVVMTFSVLLIALVSLSFILFKTPDNELKNFNVQSFSNNSYLLEADNEEFNLQFYYFANVVKHGVRTVYNTKYDYYLQYEYVSQDVIDHYDIEFNGFEYEGNRFFLEVLVNGTPSYMQVNFATDYETSWELTNLELENFKYDIEEIFRWIEAYPPELIGNNGNRPLYDIHSDVADLEDSKAKRNYITYVTNFYIPNNPIFEDNPKDYITISTNHVIIVDDENNFVESRFDKIWCIGTCVVDDIESIFTDLNSYFSFLLKDMPNNQFLPGTGYPIDRMTTESISGYIREIEFGDPYADPDNYYKDMYLLFEEIEGIEDLETVQSGTLRIQYSEAFGGDLELHDLDLFYYNNALISGPFYVNNIIDLEGAQIYDFMTVTFFDSNDQVIKELTFNFDSFYAPQ